MLVLNRRPGEAILVEPDIRIKVVSVLERKATLAMSSGTLPAPVQVSASLTNGLARLEVGPLAGVSFEDGVHVDIASDKHPRPHAQAALVICCQLNEEIEVGSGLLIAVTATKGSPRITFSGPDIGEPFSVVVIRPATSSARFGIDAAGRKVYREELAAFSAVG